MEEAQETTGEFLIATEEATVVFDLVVFDLVDEALNEMALLVEMKINRLLMSHVAAIGDDRLGIQGDDLVAQVRRIIAFVSITKVQGPKSRLCSNKMEACPMSLSWAPVSGKVKGLPKPSTWTWILVPKPPQLRPRACSPCPLFSVAPPPHSDGHARSYCRTTDAPSPGRRRSDAPSLPTHLRHTSGRSVCRRYSSVRTQPATAAIGHRCA